MIEIIPPECSGAEVLERVPSRRGWSTMSGATYRKSQNVWTIDKLLSGGHWVGWP
jgi:hypothetical protein